MISTAHAESTAGHLANGLDKLVVMWDDGPSTSLSALQHGLQQALADRGVNVVHRQRSSFIRQLARGLAKLKLVRPIAPRFGRRSLTVLSWSSEVRAFPDTYWRELIPWIFDCWGPDFHRWEALIKRHRINTAFFSARDVAQYFSQRLPHLNAIWVPEACDPTVFKPATPLVERSIDVLELGRRWSVIHDQIRDPLAKAGIRHLYDSADRRNRLFNTTEQLHDGFGDTAVMLCFPKATTHPKEAGGVETLTQRYLEAIGSGCVPVGKAPDEMIDLFGFNPVIELSMSDPAGHLQDIIANINKYQEMTRTSLSRLEEVGTFTERAQRIVAALSR